jgi:hypothetical protein
MFQVLTANLSGEIIFPVPAVLEIENLFIVSLYVHFTDGSEKRAYDWFLVEGIN